MPTDSNLYAFAKKWGPLVRDGLLGILGIGTLFLAVWKTVSGQVEVGGVLFTAGLLMVMVSEISRFKSIKGLGMEAQLQELGEKLSAADELLNHIRESAGLTADVTFQLLAQTGRPGANFSRKEALKIADAFRQQMKSLGVSDKTVNDHMLPWHRANLRELLQPVQEQIAEYLQIQNQQTNRASFDFPHDASPNHPARLANEERAAKNTRFVQSAWRLWEGDEFVYVKDVESFLLDAECSSKDERLALVVRIQPDLSSSRHYAEHLDFKSREGWISTETFYQRSGVL